MANEYPLHLRRKARKLWLSGQHTDERIASMLGMPRADTIRDWRNEEDWGLLAKDITEVVKEETEAGLRAKTKASQGAYQQLAQVLESTAIRHLRNPALPPRDLKAISGTLLNAQRLREKAVDSGGAKEDEFITSVAALYEQAHKHKNRLGNLGRCRNFTATDPSYEAVRSHIDPAAPTPNTTTGSDAAGPAP